MYTIKRQGGPPKNVDEAAAWLSMLGPARRSSWGHLPLNEKTDVYTKTVTSNGIDFTVNLAMTRFELGNVGHHFPPGLPL